MSNQPYSRYFMYLFCAILWLIVSVQPGLAAPFSEETHIYLPSIFSNNAAATSTPTSVPTTQPTPTSTPQPTPTSTPQPTPVVVQEGHFVESQWKTSDAVVRIDGAGGQHVAYYYYEAKDGESPDAALYNYCPGQCSDSAHWHSLRLAENQDVNEVQLQLTPNGKPRLLIVTGRSDGIIGRQFYYAACDTNCTSLNGWSLTFVHDNELHWGRDVLSDELPQRYFALDPQGRPRFFYADDNNSNYGEFYVFCDSQCDQTESWQQTRIDREQQSPYRQDNIYYPSLTFTSDGWPRLVSAEFYSLDEDYGSYLAYFECNANCDRTESWQRVKLMSRGSGPEPSADLDLDGDDRPRIAFYQEAELNGEGSRLFYLWCNEDCLNADHWQERDLGLGYGNGQEPDLAMDAAGQPRIAYANDERGSVGYAWCNQDCDTTSAVWGNETLEDGDILYNDWPVAYPLHCDGGIWATLTPTLVLPPSGSPLLAYDAAYWARCWYDDTTDTYPPDSVMHLIKRAVRLLSFPAP